MFELIKYSPGIPVTSDRADLYFLDVRKLGSHYNKTRRILSPGFHVLTPPEVEDAALRYFFLDVTITGRSGLLRVVPNIKSSQMKLAGVPSSNEGSQYLIDYRNPQMNIIEIEGCLQI